MCLLGHSVIRFLAHAVSRSFGQSVVQSLCQSVNRSVGQSAIHSPGHSVTRSFGRWVRRRSFLVWTLLLIRMHVFCWLPARVTGSLFNFYVFTRSFLSSPTRLVRHSVNRSFSLNRSLGHSVPRSLAHSLTRSPGNSVSRPLAQSSTRSFCHLRSFSCSFVLQLLTTCCKYCPTA